MPAGGQHRRPGTGDGREAQNNECDEMLNLHKRFATLGMVSLWKSRRAAPSGIKANEYWTR